MPRKTQPASIAGKLPILSALATLVVSGLVYLIALALPVYQFANADSFSGMMVLFLGWMGPFTSDAGNTIGWYANVFLFFAWVAMLLGKFRPMAMAAVIALIIGSGIALTSLSVSSLPINEAGGVAKVTIGLGLYAWLASFAIAFLGSLVTLAFSLFARKSEAKNEQTNGV